MAVLRMDQGQDLAWPDHGEWHGVAFSHFTLVLQLPRVQLGCEAIKELILLCNPGVGKSVVRNAFRDSTQTEQASRESQRASEGSHF